ncbi:hypothetical protein H8356DRAFT_1688469 [Neocallimastix lanati (nom. inval.)]|nr:hypothetical protein H8356DRAFT_1688469 [Neocallimastix sp. JGI-2020a]
MSKKLLTALLIATACITYVCDCKNAYICKGYGIIKNSNRGFYDCFLHKCKWITRHISTKNGCYYTPNNTRGGFSWRGYVNRDARVYNIVLKYCLTEYGWCWRG